MTCSVDNLEIITNTFGNDIVIGVECIFTWYWIANFCAERNIEFALGHALYMAAIYKGKTKSDKIDSENWLKASIEYENQSFQHLGSVVTNNGYSDWATTEISANVKSMKIKNWM